MSGPRRQGTGQRSGARSRGGPARDFWGRDDAEVAPAAPIVPLDDSSVLIRSLGPPPLPGRESVAEHYFAMVYDKATALGTALAAASGLLAGTDPDGEERAPAPGGC